MHLNQNPLKICIMFSEEDLLNHLQGLNRIQIKSITPDQNQDQSLKAAKSYSKMAVKQNLG